MEAGTAPNIIPDKAVVTGSVRPTSRATREGIEEKIKRIIGGVSTALRCETEVKYTRIYPVTVNDAGLTDVLTAAAGGILGAAGLVEMPIIMGSEDFSYYGEKVPAAYGVLGMADPAVKGSDQPHHSPRFAVNEAVLAHGASILAAFALAFLSDGR